MQIHHESIFTSALRSFLRAFFAVCGLLLGFFVFSMIYSILAGGALIEEKTTLNILPDLEAKKELVSPSAPAILQINIHGPIGIDLTDINTANIENILVESRTGLLSHNRVKGVLLHINSPGGTVIDSDNIYRMLKEYKKRYNVPIFAYVDGLCASGGMYIACAADKIFASPTSAIGSVGVIYGPFFNVYNTLGKIGIEAKTLTEGLDKDALNPTRPWKEGEDQWIKDLLSANYERFLSIVTEARTQLSKEDLIHVLGAKMFDGTQAEKLGYIDQADSSRTQTLLALMQEANVDPSHPYQVVQLEPKRNWLNGIMTSNSPLFSGKIEHTFDLKEGRRCSPFAYLYQPK